MDAPRSDDTRDQWLTGENIDAYWTENRVELIRYGFMNEHFRLIEDRDHPAHNPEYGNGYSDGEWNVEMMERVVLDDETPNVIKAGNDGKTKLVHDKKGKRKLTTVCTSTWPQSPLNCSCTTAHAVIISD